MPGSFSSINLLPPLVKWRSLSFFGKEVAVNRGMASEEFDFGPGRFVIEMSTTRQPNMHLVCAPVHSIAYLMFRTNFANPSPGVYSPMKSSLADTNLLMLCISSNCADTLTPALVYVHRPLARRIMVCITWTYAFYGWRSTQQTNRLCTQIAKVDRLPVYGLDQEVCSSSAFRRVIGAALLFPWSPLRRPSYQSDTRTAWWAWIKHTNRHTDTHTFPHVLTWHGWLGVLHGHISHVVGVVILIHSV